MSSTPPYITDFALHAARLAAGLLLWLSLLLAAIVPVSAETVLTLFAGGASQRPDLLRSVLDDYEAANPGLRIVVRTGAATSELQRRYLSTLLNARDPGFDALLLDIVAPAQFAAAGWLEPLDPYFGTETESVFAGFLPVYRSVNRHRSRWVALPFDTSALFLYYRTDLLEKYGVATPATWPELAAAAERILAAEKNPSLRGLSFQGAPIEGAVATFLIPYWSAGVAFTDAQGRLSLDRASALGSFRLPVGILLYQGEYTFPWPVISAALVVGIVPLALLIVVFQERVVGGLSAGGLKG